MKSGRRATWTLTVRAGPKVSRLSFQRLDEALEALEARAHELAEGARRAPVNVRYRRFEPGRQVAARLELAGPQRWLPEVRAGVDVRGDGQSEAFLGRVRRRVVAPRGAETAVSALRRALEESPPAADSRPQSRR